MENNHSPSCQKIVFLGGGNMAEAIFAKLSTNDKFKIEVIQRNPDKRARLKELYPNISVYPSLDYPLAAEDILVLAIKPQQAKDACLAIKDKIDNCLIVSVMAGLAINNLNSWLTNARIIRTMPNTPSAIQKGVTAIYYPQSITAHEKATIDYIFNNIGLIYYAKEEVEVDKILPVTSSAIAFVYYFMEGMIDNAVNKFGFDPIDARNLVCQVLEGSVGLVKANPEITINELRARVTSKKGTTEQGILTFERNNFQQIIGEAMQNSFNRGLELAKEFS